MNGQQDQQWEASSSCQVAGFRCVNLPWAFLCLVLWYWEKDLLYAETTSKLSQKDENSIYIFFPQTFILNWRKIASQHCVGLCHTSAWVSLRYTCAPPSSPSLSPPTQSHPSRLFQSPSLSSLSPTENACWLSILHMVVYTLPCYFLQSSHPLLPPTASIHKFVLYVCVSIAALYK